MIEEVFKTEEKLPEESKSVLTFNNSVLDKFAICLYIADEDKFYNLESANYIKRPSHWAYLKFPDIIK